MANDVPGITASLYLDSVEYWAPCQALDGTGAWGREPATRKRAPDNIQVSVLEAYKEAPGSEAHSCGDEAGRGAPGPLVLCSV